MIRKIIREILGKQISIHNLSRKISNDVEEAIKRNFHKMNDGDAWGFTTQTRPTPDIVEDTKISIVKININFKYSEQFKLSGAFKQGQTILLNDDTYEVYIDLNLQTNTIDDIFRKISPFISHELNHAFVDIKGLGGNRRAFTKNAANKMTNRMLNGLIDKYPALKRFTSLIYLANPYEVQARVQETSANLEHMDEKTANDTINALLKFKPLRDATQMIKFSLDDVNKMDKDDLELFVKTFNDNIKLFSKEDNPKTIYDVDKFMSYWKDVIHYNGNELAMKIYKLAADKFNMHEGFLYEQSDAYYRIFGEYF